MHDRVSSLQLPAKDSKALAAEDLGAYKNAVKGVPLHLELPPSGELQSLSLPVYGFVIPFDQWHCPASRSALERALGGIVGLPPEASTGSAVQHPHVAASADEVQTAFAKVCCQRLGFSLKQIQTGIAIARELFKTDGDYHWFTHGLSIHHTNPCARPWPF